MMKHHLKKGNSMLINTIIIFLQSALPMFIVIALLLLCLTDNLERSKRIVTIKKIVALNILVIILVLLLNYFMEEISQLFDGKGTEFVFSAGFILIYLCCALVFLLGNKRLYSRAQKSLSLVILLLVLTLNSSNFMLYLTSYWTQSLTGEYSGVESLFVGIILAVGICISVAILLFFFLRYCDANLHKKTSNYFLLFFALAQLMQSIVLLQQVDVLPLSYSLWNSSNFITESSEIGQLLRVLIGYETTPSLMQLIVYICAFIIPVYLSTNRFFVRFTSGEAL